MRGHSVTLSGDRKVEIRRLGLDDIEAFSEILGSIMEGAANRALLTGVPFDLSSTASIAATFASGLRYAKRPLREWVVSLISIPESEMALEDWGAVLHAMTSHPDATSFLEWLRLTGKTEFAAQVKALVKTPPPEASPESST